MKLLFSFETMYIKKQIFILTLKRKLLFFSYIATKDKSNWKSKRAMIKLDKIDENSKNDKYVM